MANCPTGPQPQTATTSPGWMPQFSAAIHPVGKTSERKRICSSGTPSGILIGPTSANGTRAYCAWPPANPPVMCEYPNRPDVVKPYSFSAIQAFGFVLSHSDQSCFSQKKQLPHAIVKGTTTRSPTFSFVFSLPT